MNFNGYAKKLSALTGMIAVFCFAPLVSDDWGGLSLGFTSAAFAKDGGDGGGSGNSGSGNSGSGNSGSGNSGSGNSGSGNSGSGNSGSGKSGAGYSGQGYSGRQGGGDEQSQSIPDTIFRHVNGWVEGIFSGTYIVRDNKSRTVIKRAATPADVERINRENDR